MLQKMGELAEKKAPTTTFDTLPIELQLLILGLLTPAELCKTAIVSRIWQQLSEDDVLWKRFLSPEFQNNDFQKKFLYKLVIVEAKKILDSIKSTNIDPIPFTTIPIQPLATNYNEIFKDISYPKKLAKPTPVNQITFFKQLYDFSALEKECKSSLSKYFKHNDHDDDFVLKKT